MTKPWQQLAKESSKAFAAFHAYLTLGPERSLEAAAEKVGKCSKVLERWSKKFGWGERAKGYDAHLVAVTEQAKEVELRAEAVGWAKREIAQKELEWQNAEQAMQRVREFLAMPITEMTVRDAALLLEVASKLGRLACGMPAEVQAPKAVTGPTYSFDVEAVLIRAYSKKGKLAEVEKLHERSGAGS